MPELPEVETVRRVLEPQLCGRTISRVDLARPELIAHPEAEAFCRRLPLQRFERLSRRGKFLLAHFDSGDRLLLHLRMTGSLLRTPAKYPAEKHTHLNLALEDGSALRFIDPRRFGRLWLFAAGEEDHVSGIASLGLEPLDPALSAAYLQEHLARHRRAIKPCLLDQSIVAGIGNIYADEILFAARIHPARPANSLTLQEWERLAACIPERIAFFIDRNAISAEDYLRGRGEDYRNTPFLQVYGHAGSPCPDCGTPLCRIQISSRSSTFCPHCQPESL